MKLTLKQWRMLNDWSLEKSAEMLGVSRLTVFNWEHGKTYPNAKNIKAIEDAYNIKWSDDVLMP